MLLLHLVCLAAIQVSCKSTVLLSQSAREIANQLLISAKRDIEPSLQWAAVQIEALVPVELANRDDDSLPSRDLWSFTSDKSIMDGVIPAEIILSDHHVRTVIIKAMGMLGKAVIKSLKPGLSQAVVHLLKNHTSNPLTKDQLFSKEEIANFIAEVSENWSNALKMAVNDWSQNHLDSLLGFVKRILSDIGQEILKRLGRAAGLMNIDTHHGRFNAPKSVDLFDNIRDSSHRVAMASLTFLHGSGWMSKQLAESLPSEPVVIEDDWRLSWDDKLWEMWDL